MRGACSSATKALLALALFATQFIALFCAPLSQSAVAQQSPIAPRPLITQLVDESQRTVLRGNTHPLARPQYDLGTAPATLPMQRMLLVLKRSPDQEYALRSLLDNQQDKRSSSYHKWLTPQQVGAQFGPADADMQTITLWLQSHGFQVGTTKGRGVLEFSGSASQVQEAFHTAIHKYIVNGEQHWANASDPSIPTALTPAVAGVLTLHNFLKKPQIRMTTQTVAGKVRPGKSPALTFSDVSHGIAPADFATIYNSAGLNSMFTGSGVTIGVIGRSNLYNSAADVQNFDGSFDVCCGVFNVVLNGPDPGDLGGGDEAEATLDSTWTGGVAPSANVNLVVSASTNTADGIDLSEVFIIENNFADVMTESFSSCEAGFTSAEAAGVSALAEQAAAQGITYFVSTGDSGAEGCDDPNSETVATGPVSVNLLASTPFNVAVGGTVLNEHGESSLYWSGTNTNQESAISYIPEDVWNDSCLSATCGTTANIAAGSGGSSIFFGKPSWQAGVTGIVQDNARDLPDVSLTASPHDGYVLCLEGSCVPNAQGEFFLSLVGGTSAAAPSFAGIMALIDGRMASLNPAQGPRQGQANYILYRLAASQNATLSSCNASSTTALPGSACIFNDVTVGNNAVPGEVNYGLAGALYQAGIGYDMATGLGSVNITNLVNQWNSVTFNPTTTTLALSPVTAIAHGSSVGVNIAVAPSSGTGSPTGDVSLLAFTGTGQGTQTAAGFFPLSAGSVVSSTDLLPGGTYNVSAQYAGDATYAASTSLPISVTVTPEGSTTSLSVLTMDASGNALPFTGGPFGSFVCLRADVAGSSLHGTPTGMVNFADTFGAIPGGSGFPLNSGDQLGNGSNTATPNGVLTFDTGKHTISASYLGDASFTASNTTQSMSFTIQPGFFAALSPTQSQVTISAPGSTGSTSVSVSSSTGFTGTIALACTGLPAGAACTFSPASIKAMGTPATTTSTISVTTTAAAAALQTPAHSFPGRWLASGGFVIFSVMLIGAGSRRGKAGFPLALVALIAFVPACGGGGGSSSSPPPTPAAPATVAGTYNVVINASSGSITSSAVFTVLVQ